MRTALLKFETGIAAGTGTKITEHLPFVVGSAPECDVSIRALGVSLWHFEIRWDGTRCQLIDLGSGNGTFVNGRAVSTLELRDGDRIEAGDRVFVVEIGREAPAAGAPKRGESLASVPEPSHGSWPVLVALSPSTPVPSSVAVPTAPSTPLPPRHASWGPPRPRTLPVSAPSIPPRPAALPSAAVVAIESGPARPPLEIFTNVERAERVVPATNPALGEALTQLRRVSKGAREDDRLYALVDGAAAVDVAMAARELGHRLYTLFEGELAIEVASSGPILIPLEGDPVRFLQRWVDARGRNAGVLLRTHASLDALFAHLRHVFVVKEETGDEYFLRFYDPRVLRRFLPTCSVAQRSEFFGPVQRYVIETATGEGYENVTLESFPAPERADHA